MEVAPAPLIARRSSGNPHRSYQFSARRRSITVGGSDVDVALGRNAVNRTAVAEKNTLNAGGRNVDVAVGQTPMLSANCSSQNHYRGRGRMLTWR